jgi:hypothetical protein
MKSSIASALTLLIIVTGAGPALADVDVVLHGSPALTGQYQKAVDACMAAFMAKVAPEGSAPVHAPTLPPSRRPSSRLGQSTLLLISLEARSANHQVRARSNCSVVYNE